MGYECDGSPSWKLLIDPPPSPGLGVVRTLSYQIAGEVATGRLEHLFADDAAPVLPISLLFQSGRKSHPNVRAFIEVAKRHLRESSLQTV